MGTTFWAPNKGWPKITNILGHDEEKRLNFIEHLKVIEVNHLEEPSYSLDEITKISNELIKLDGSCWLALKVTTSFDDDKAETLENCWMQFGLFRFVSAESDNSNTLVDVIFHGEGPTGSLRECRHIWWGQCGDGYTFYLPGQAVISALKELGKYYDFN